MKTKIITTLILISFSYYGICSFSEWSNQTKYGNTILNYSGYGIQIITTKSDVKFVKRWYFKNDYIIGEQENKKLNYFVLNEKKDVLKTFNSKRQWDKYILKNNLKPKIYTRWFKDNWDIYKKGFFIFYILIFPLSFPLTFLYVFVLYSAIKREKFKFNKPFTLIFLTISLLILIDIIMSKFPQSL